MFDDESTVSVQTEMMKYCYNKAIRKSSDTLTATARLIVQPDQWLPGYLRAHTMNANLRSLLSQHSAAGVAGHMDAHLVRSFLAAVGG